MSDTAANVLIAIPALLVGAYLTVWWARETARERRRDIRRLEHYVNHPANRTRRDQNWKEDRP